VGRDSYVPLVVDEVLRETEKAFLFLIDGAEVWIPRSQMEDPDGCTVGELECEVYVSRWIAGQKDLL
jgi:hypothetical protein